MHSSLQDHDESVLHVLDGLVLAQSLHLEELMVIIALSLQSLYFSLQAFDLPYERLFIVLELLLVPIVVLKELVQISL